MPFAMESETTCKQNQKNKTTSVSKSPIKIVIVKHNRVCKEDERTI